MIVFKRAPRAFWERAVRNIIILPNGPPSTPSPRRIRVQL
jgi:hypothetical protein